MVNDDKEQLTRERLHLFVAGRLSEAEDVQILGQLADDEAALALVDALWNEEERQTAVGHLPDLKPDRARRVRRRLVQQIHRADLTKNVVKMGTQGFGRVAASLLKPLLDPQNRERRHRRRTRGYD